MFISVLDLFKLGIGPSSSHTMGPMLAANNFRQQIRKFTTAQKNDLKFYVRCILKGSLAFTGKGHGTDRAVTLGLHGYSPKGLGDRDVNELVKRLCNDQCISFDEKQAIKFIPADNIIFDCGEPLPEHPNGMIFELVKKNGHVALTETYFSIGGGFIHTLAEIGSMDALPNKASTVSCPYAFDSADSMVQMATSSKLSIAAMKRLNEQSTMTDAELNDGLDTLWSAMCACIEKGLETEGVLPGGLNISRRAKVLFEQLQNSAEENNPNDWLCAYAMAVNEENAAGHRVVTAPTNGAAGVIPAVLYYAVKHEGGNVDQVREFLLTAAAIGGIIKHRSSISGAEVGCQGEVGSAAAMAAAGLCAICGGSAQQIENAAEIALEHHLGMTCDPVGGLVQVPCIERNGFGAIKAYTASSLAMRGTGKHFMSLDKCIAAMKETGREMSVKYKETSLGGLAVSFTEC